MQIDGCQAEICLRVPVNVADTLNAFKVPVDVACDVQKQVEGALPLRLLSCAGYSSRLLSSGTAAQSHPQVPDRLGLSPRIPAADICHHLSFSLSLLAVPSAPSPPCLLITQLCTERCPCLWSLQDCAVGWRARLPHPNGYNLKVIVLS